MPRENISKQNCIFSKFPLEMFIHELVVENVGNEIEAKEPQFLDLLIIAGNIETWVKVEI